MRRSFDELEGLFDLLIVHHVLEHVPNVAEFLSTLAGLLKQGGSSYIEVPDAMRYADFAYEPWLDFNLEHINHFFRWHLDAAMGRAGFSRFDSGAKTLDMARDWGYPAIYGLWRLIRVAPRIMKPNIALVRAAEQYIDVSTGLQKDWTRSFSLDSTDVTLWRSGGWVSSLSVGSPPPRSGNSKSSPTSTPTRSSSASPSVGNRFLARTIGSSRSSGRHPHLRLPRGYRGRVRADRSNPPGHQARGKRFRTT